ncbi:GyrI-like domain-containing protein [Anaerostipes sp.]|uniref:GyrI-like domain-containing protein n=1 Tax=Anaerostipes sp. TaxID=1872530 RepID=UPI0025BF8124|nr:GyrI-like domain-containing protein [Anaerostipes sp.]MBS7007804.1 GyrI-like domain-containing protein [Anaerostipes sp.]
MEKLDYKKEYRDLYMPKKKPALVDVPEMTFFMVDGKGEPGGSHYQQAMELLYAFSFTIKMSKMGKDKPEGYFEYVVPPLEGLWWTKDGMFVLDTPREEWLWTSMIRQPEFVTEAVFEWAKKEISVKKPGLDVSRIRMESFTEGKCVQAMHVGSYAQEADTMEKMAAFMEENGLKSDVGNKRRHHEIYLSDPRRTAPERLKTVLRTPVL